VKNQVKDEIGYIVGRKEEKVERRSSSFEATKRKNH
jgi:hypothetical protein